MTPNVAGRQWELSQGSVATLKGVWDQPIQRGSSVMGGGKGRKNWDVRLWGEKETKDPVKSRLEGRTGGSRFGERTVRKVRGDGQRSGQCFKESGLLADATATWTAIIPGIERTKEGGVAQNLERMQKT